mmetsp:Transcript_39656/g.71432  ORF Transcript_39656/g.71432 Transcript_39656/m.71432 type:complete len:174 (+) Transcript_39656:94-615(+)
MRDLLLEDETRLTLFNRLTGELNSLPVGMRTNEIIEDTVMRVLATVNSNYMAGFGEVVEKRKKPVTDTMKFTVERPMISQGFVIYTFGSKDMTNRMKKNLRSKLNKLSSLLLTLTHAAGAGTLINTNEKTIAFLTKAFTFLKTVPILQHLYLVDLMCWKWKWHGWLIERMVVI